MENIDTLFKTITMEKTIKNDISPEDNHSSIVNIISWNYDLKKKGITKDKIDLLHKQNIDIVVIQECTYYESVFFRKRKLYKYVNWYGDGKDSIYGICILSNNYEPHIIDLNRNEQKFRYIVPYEITIQGKIILLLAVWTKKNIKWGNENDDFHRFSYTENVLEAIKFYNDLLHNYSDIIIIGDFNTFYKKLEREKEHIQLVDRFKEYKIFNSTAFPGYQNSEIDFETEATYYHEYNPDKPGTNDFCFIKESNNIYLKKFGIGYPEKWINYSDHFPIWIQFAVRKPK